MDTTLDPTSPETVDSDALVTETETPGFGKELTKTLVVSTGTSAAVFGGFVVFALVAPKVTNWWRSRKSNVIEGEVVTETAPETETPKKA